MTEQGTNDDIKIINTGCCHDCGGRCVLRAHVKDGKIIRFETDNSEEPQIRACMRGRAYRQRVYHPDRLKYPLRRVGERGEGRFEQITWDEALDEVASKLLEIKEKYGNPSILLMAGGGNQGMIHGVVPVGLMLNQFGGYTRFWGAPSYEGALFSSMATYGTITTGSAREDLLNSKFIEEYKRDNEIYYKITNEGEDELMIRIKNVSALKRLVHRLVVTFDGLLGGSVINEKIQSKSISGYTLSYKDYVFALLSINWRLNRMFNAGNEVKSLTPDKNMSFGNTLDYNAEKYADRPALLYEDIKYTHKELNEWMNRYANYFLSLGLKKGDVINVLLENRPELLIVIGAMAKIGTIASLINTRQRSSSLIHSLRLNKIKAYVIGEELYHAFENVKADLGLTSKERLYFLKDKGNMVIPEGFIDLKEEAKDQDISTPTVINEIRGIDPYAYIFTSGTTGLPKAAPMRHIHMMGAI
ncbi:unnamed protein product, partial [marine sediment metagenome]